MSQTPRLYFFAFFALVIAIGLSLQLISPLPLSEQLALIFSPTVNTFEQANFLYAQMPRLVMALLVGAMLGLVGSLMQQLTQNPLASPLTLGTSSGAWLALIIISIFFTGLSQQAIAFFAMLGALIAMSLVIIIAGFRHLTGLPLVLSGMVVNILLGAIATSLILLNDQYAQNVFIWGAGDLAQDGWTKVQWLLPRLLPVFILLIIAPKVLSLLRLGQAGASARGLSVIPYFLFTMVLGLWLVSASITMVGVISFIGLIAPNIARSLGARTPFNELMISMLLGSVALVCTDLMAQIISQHTLEMIPSGTAAAAIGAPALIWFSRRRLKAQDRLSFSLPPSKERASLYLLPVLLVLTIAMLIISLTVVMTDHGLVFSLPDSFSWSLRWPRTLTALFAGIGLALAGCVLQRLVYNPLASPDILGISAGATFALVGGSLYLGLNLFVSGFLIAFCGSLVVLLALLLLARKHQFSASSLVLIGIAISALLESLVQFALSKGGEERYAIISWLAGSTYRVSANNSLLLAFAVVVIGLLLMLYHRWIALISIGRQFALARGVAINHASVILLIAVALLCAIVTSTMGPIAFVGLLAPHIALMLGARRALEQLLTSALIGGLLMLCADWLGQVLIFPMQIAAGTVVSVLGGSYFLFLLIRGRQG